MARAMRLKTTCTRDCPDACGLVVTVEEGKAVRLEGDPDHPVTKGFLCPRTSRFLERQYDPDRITSPLLRDGTGFKPIAWDEALDRIARAMLRFRDESGPASILYYRSGGSLGILKNLGDHFFEQFGPVSVKSGDICSGGGDAAQMEDFGEEDSHDLFDLLNSRTIVLWGKNAQVSSVHLMPVLLEAGKRGAKLIQIDPVRHRGAAVADLYLQPRPGGDIALALGVARLLFERGRTDPAAATYCDHIEEFRALAFSRTPDAWARLADVPLEQLDALAGAYADGPSSIQVGWGMQRRTNGSAAVRVLDALCAISGNLGVAGGGVSFYFKRRGAFDLSCISGTAPRAFSEPLLGRLILDAKDPPVRMVWVTCGNPVASLPDSCTVARALESREMTVVVDSFLTDTARCATIVLPTTTMLEDDDLLGAYGHHWIGEARPVLAAPDGVKTDLDILRTLAPRVGMEERFCQDAQAWKEKLLARVSERGASLAALRERAVRNPLAPTVLFADRKFKTESGRVNLIHGVPVEPPHATAERPLLLMALSTDKAQATQWKASEQQGPAPAIVHPDAAKGFQDGALARVESEVGELTVRLRFDPLQRRDVLLMEKGGWLNAGRCANALVPAKETDAGGGAVYYDTPVRLLPS